MLKARFKQLALLVAGKATAREVRLLPLAAAREQQTIELRAPYRVEGATLMVQLLEPGPGRLGVELLERTPSVPGRQFWDASAPYAGPTTLSLDFESGDVLLGALALGRAPSPGRRFCLRLRLQAATGEKGRLTGHYRPIAAQAVDQRYFEGDAYTDHQQQGASEAETILACLERYGARGPLLEIGCATGQVLRAIEATGLPAYGIDSSAWAVQKARSHHRPDRVYHGDVDSGPWPEQILATAPFQSVLLWSVLEHLRDPFGTLGRLAELLAPGGLLLLQATNAESLTHLLFGRDWEGYFDWTHLGVDAVSVSSLRSELPRYGYTIEHLHTHMVWTGSDDPNHATLRDWHAADARMRRLLRETDRGDLVLVAARRTSARV